MTALVADAVPLARPLLLAQDDALDELETPSALFFQSLRHGYALGTVDPSVPHRQAVRTHETLEVALAGAVFALGCVLCVLALAGHVLGVL